VNAVVKTAAGARTDLTVRGPVSTAAVRGTALNFDVNIDLAECLSGHFDLVSNTTGQAMSVGPGMFAVIDQNGHATPSDRILAQRSSSGWVPNDLLYWASINESGWSLAAPTDSLTAKNVLPIAGEWTTLTIEVN
jgi:hypothetical protein